MKTTLIAGLFALTTAISSVALAAPDNNSDRYVQRLTTELGLTPGQEEKMLELHTGHMDKMKALREDQQREVDAILDDEQRAKLKKMRENRRGKSMHQRRDEENRYPECAPNTETE